MFIAAGFLNLPSKRGHVPGIARAGDYQFPLLESRLPHKVEECFQQQLQSLLRVDPRKHENVRRVIDDWMLPAKHAGALAGLEVFCLNSKRDDDPAGELQGVFRQLPFLSGGIVDRGGAAQHLSDPEVPEKSLA